MNENSLLVFGKVFYEYFRPDHAEKMATFEELMKQVASMRAETTNLRRELQHNAGSISKLETDAHSMAHAWTHLQHAIEDDDDDDYEFPPSVDSQPEDENDNRTATAPEDSTCDAPVADTGQSAMDDSCAEIHSFCAVDDGEDNATMQREQSLVTSLDVQTHSEDVQGSGLDMNSNSTIEGK